MKYIHSPILSNFENNLISVLFESGASLQEYILFLTKLTGFNVTIVAKTQSPVSLKIIIRK